MLALLLTAALPSAVAVRLLTGDTCNALTSTSLQMKGEKLGSVAVPSRESCCEECKKMTGCQMWWFQDNTSPFMCEMYSLDKVRSDHFVRCGLSFFGCSMGIFAAWTESSAHRHIAPQHTSPAPMLRGASMHAAQRIRSCR
jgi:hypothetical protein